MYFRQWKRREFMTLLGSVVAACGAGAAAGDADGWVPRQRDIGCVRLGCAHFAKA
jgi:hypothetical protein